jgi:hypothetical protein
MSFHGSSTCGTCGVRLVRDMFGVWYHDASQAGVQRHGDDFHDPGPAIEDLKAIRRSEREGMRRAMNAQWALLLVECSLMEKELDDKVGVNAWVGVDTRTGLYGGFSFDGDIGEESADIDGETPEEVLGGLIAAMIEYREKLELENAEVEE